MVGVLSAAVNRPCQSPLPRLVLCLLARRYAALSPDERPADPHWLLSAAEIRTLASHGNFPLTPRQLRLVRRAGPLAGGPLAN
jgi:hypothetical protein